MGHMLNKLLKGERASYDAFEGQGAHQGGLVIDLYLTRLGTQAQGDTASSQRGGHILVFEIELNRPT
jgi:hypothetical protein